MSSNSVESVRVVGDAVVPVRKHYGVSLNGGPVDQVCGCFDYVNIADNSRDHLRPLGAGKTPVDDGRGIGAVNLQVGDSASRCAQSVRNENAVASGVVGLDIGHGKIICRRSRRQVGDAV